MRVLSIFAWRHVPLASLYFFASVSACSSDKAEPYPDVTTFCAAKAKAECQVTTVCYTDQTICLTYRASLCNTDAATAQAGGVRKYMSGKAQACIDAAGKAYAGSGAVEVAYAMLVGPGSVTDICERVLRGSVGNDEACQSDYDCANDRICAQVAPGVPAQVCAAPMAVAAGDFCENPGSSCALDSYCAVQANGSALCAPSAAAGQPCNDALPCVSAARCGSGTCVARASAGQTCSQASDCSPDAPYCNPYGSVCTTGFAFARGSEDCIGFTVGSGGDGGSVMTSHAGAGRASPE